MEKSVKPAALAKVFRVALIAVVFAARSPGQQASRRANQVQSALTFEQEGKIAEAEAAWKSVLIQQPNDSEAYAHLGLLQARQEHYREAIVNYRRALSINPNMPAVQLDLGLSLYKSGDLRGAITNFAPLLKRVPGSSPEAIRLVTLIGLAHYGLGEYAAAVPYLKKAAAADSANLALRMTLAQSCLSSKQYQCVLDVYREILAINPNSAEADVLAGEAYDELKNDAGALEQFQAAVKADPRLPNVHFGYGYLLWKASRYSDAQEEFRAELSNNPENPLALAYLGDTMIKLNHSGEAMPYLQHALRLEPSLAIAQVDLGIVYENAGRKSDALRELKSAEKLTPDDPVVHWHLGRLYQSLGQKADAQKEFEKTRNLQNATQQSLREQMHQAEAKPSARSANTGTR
jgi:tetratricopeptide (TPR) repeat protein